MVRASQPPALLLSALLVVAFVCPTAFANAGSGEDHPGRPPLVEAAAGTDEDVQYAITHSLKTVEPFPVNASDAIVVGRVLGAVSYLAPDGSSVRTRFTVRLEEVLKDTPGPGTLAGRSLVGVERAGGVVLLQSGKSLSYTAQDAGLPEVGVRYAFFLACGRRGESALVIRLYALRDDRVDAVDAVGKVSAGESAFLSDLRRTILESR